MPSNVTRRLALASPLMLTGASRARDGVDPRDELASDRLLADVTTYAAAGFKRTATPQSDAVGDWIAARLGEAGAVTSRQAFQVETFSVARADLDLGDQTIEGFAQWPSAPAGRFEGVLKFHRPPGIDPELGRCLAVMRLPYLKSADAQIATVVAMAQTAFASRAAGLIVVTEGPSGEVIAMNAPQAGWLADGRWPLPVLLVGARHLDALEQAAAAQRPATLTIDAEPVSRTTSNIIGRFDRRGPVTIVTSPYTGWFGCAAERGTGLAMFLDLARFVGSHPSMRDRSFTFAATAGHELDDAGALRFMEDAADPPETTSLWLRLGAGMGARAWQTARRDLQPLPSPEPERRILCASAEIETVRSLMSGQPGLEAPTAIDDARGLPGEVGALIRRGYRRHISFYGWHTLHHTRRDDLTCTDGAVMVPVADALRKLVSFSRPLEP